MMTMGIFSRKSAKISEFLRRAKRLKTVLENNTIFPDELERDNDGGMIEMQEIMYVCEKSKKKVLRFLARQRKWGERQSKRMEMEWNKQINQALKTERTIGPTEPTAPEGP